MPRLIFGAREQVPRRGVGASFAFYIERQEELCKQLEALADRLPHRLDTHLGLQLARGLYPILRRSHRFEEDVVHPLLLSCRPRLGKTLRRLRDEHLEDEDRANKLRDAVAALVRDPSRRSAEVVGSMLRGFFSGLRRHPAFEREQLLPLLLGDPVR